MRSRGFTLPEILVVLGILALIAGLGLFASMDAYRITDLRSERDTAVALLERARSHSMNNLYGLAHGICYDESSSTYVLFKETYSSHAIEETLAKGSAATLSGFPLCGSGEEVVFTQLSGTTTPATITLSDGRQVFKIDVNEEGAVLW